jgi:hypothetical protein
MSFPPSSYSYFFPHGLDFGGKGQSLQDLLDSGDYAGKPKVARNLDGHREMFVVGTDDIVYHAWEWPPNSNNWSDWRQFGNMEAAFPRIILRRNAVGGVGVIVVNKRNRGMYKNDQVHDRQTGLLNKWTGWRPFNRLD